MSKSVLLAIKTKSKLIYLERSLIIYSLFILVFLTTTQLISRNLFDSGYPVFDVISRHIIFFIIFPGAALSCENNQAIKLDILTPLLTSNTLTLIQKPLSLISSFICFAFTWYSTLFFLDELTHAAVNEKISVYMTISIPLGFLILGSHLLLLSVTGHATQTSQDDSVS